MKNIKFLHMADTHLGFNAYTALNENGINQREADAMNAFEQITVWCEQNKPDFVIHAGDLFHTVSPSNRTITFALDQLERMSKVCPVIVAGGNHEKPKRIETGHIFDAIEVLPYIHAVHDKYEYFDFDGVRIHVIPHFLTEEALKTATDAIEYDPKVHNILVTHGTTHNVDAFKHTEFVEQNIDGLLDSTIFSYIALGHYHNQRDISHIAAYSGSPFQLTFSKDEKPEKGFLDVHIDHNRIIHKKFIPVHTRPIKTLPTIIANGMTANEISIRVVELINKTSNNTLNGDKPIVRIRIEGIPPEIHKSLDFKAIDTASKNTLHCDVQFNFEGLETETTSDINMNNLTQELSQFILDNIPEDDPARNKLWEIAGEHFITPTET